MAGHMTYCSHYGWSVDVGHLVASSWYRRPQLGWQLWERQLHTPRWSLSYGPLDRPTASAHNAGNPAGHTDTQHRSACNKISPKQSSQTNPGKQIGKHSPKTDKLCNVYIMNGINHELAKYPRQREWNQVFRKDWALPVPHVAPVTIHGTIHTFTTPTVTVCL